MLPAADAPCRRGRRARRRRGGSRGPGRAPVHVASSITARRSDPSSARSRRSPPCRSARAFAAAGATRTTHGSGRNRSPSARATASTGASSATRSSSASTSGRQRGHVAPQRPARARPVSPPAPRGAPASGPSPSRSSNANAHAQPGREHGWLSSGGKDDDHLARRLGDPRDGVLHERHAVDLGGQLVGAEPRRPAPGEDDAANRRHRDADGVAARIGTRTAPSRTGGRS